MENKENIGNRNLVNENAAAKDKLKTARKSGMTRGALTSGLIGLFLLIVAGVTGYTLYTKEQNKQLAIIENQRNLFTDQLTARDSIINDWLLTFDQIENDLVLIKQKENILTVSSSEAELSKDRKTQILEDIKSINELLESNKKKIASLTAQLNKSGGSIKGLQVKIASLETTLKQYETDISELKTSLAQKDIEIGQLNSNVSALALTVTEKDEKITEQINLMNQAYLVSGTYKELKEKGILIKEGGFLGLGRRESLVGDLSDTLFARIDVREIKMIPVNSKNVKLITEHPSDSYEVVQENENLIAYIEIKDPETFWKISKYAVVEIIK